MNKQSKLTKALVVATALSMPAFAHASQPAGVAKVAKASVQAKRTIDLENAVALDFDLDTWIKLGKAVWNKIKSGDGSGSGSGSGSGGNGTGGNGTGGCGNGGASCTGGGTAGSPA